MCAKYDIGSGVIQELLKSPEIVCPQSPESMLSIQPDSPSLGSKHPAKAAGGQGNGSINQAPSGPAKPERYLRPIFLIMPVELCVYLGLTEHALEETFPECRHSFPANRRPETAILAYSRVRQIMPDNDLPV
jgi:hypothetical protein